MHKKVSLFFLSDLVLILLVSSFFVSCKSLDKYYSANAKLAPYDAIIVPGIPFTNGKWDYIMQGRVLWSVYLYKHGIAKNIIYSGSSVYSPFIEGKIMALYAEQLGVKPENIFVEPKAEHSTENVYYGYRLAQKNGFKTVAVASDRFQTRTLISYLRKLKRKINADVKCLPMQEELVKEMKFDQAITVDSMQAHVNNFRSLYDRQGFFTRFRGTMGKHIDYKDL